MTMELSPHSSLEGLTVDELAEIANTEHRLAKEEADQAKSHLTEAVLHGIASGKALLVVKARIPDEWAEWTSTKLEFSQASAHRYCRWAYYEDKILAAEVPLNSQSIVHFLRDEPMLPSAAKGKPRPKLVRTPETEAQVKKLAAEGMKLVEIAEVTEISMTTIRVILDPAYDKRRRDRQRAKSRERREAYAALRRKRQKEAAKRAGGGRLDKAFALIHQYRAEIDAAILDVEAGREELRQSLLAAQKATSTLNAAISKMG
jgi:transposase